MANITSTNFNGFFSKKSIMVPYFFDVQFPGKTQVIGVNDNILKAFNDYISGFLLPADIDGQTGLFKLEKYCVKSVSIPDFSFKKDGIVKNGPFATSVPVMDFDGFELKIEFEEDSSGTIKRMIQWFQARNIHRTGTYWPPAVSQLPYIQINILGQTPNDGENDKVIGSFKFHEVSFLNVTEVTLSYSDNSPVGYNVTFNTNYYNYEWN